MVEESTPLGDAVKAGNGSDEVASFNDSENDACGVDNRNQKNHTTDGQNQNDDDSELDFERELERGLQQAKDAWLGKGKSLDVAEVVKRDDHVEVDKGPEGGGLAGVLLQEAQENGLSEAQMLRKEKERHYASLLASLHEKELDRYEAYRRSSLPRGKMRKLLMTICGQTINDEKVLIVVCSLAKMFVGELVEMARECATVEKFNGPLLRDHIHKAYRRMEVEGRILHRRKKRKLFRLV